MVLLRLSEFDAPESAFGLLCPGGDVRPGPLFSQFLTERLTRPADPLLMIIYDPDNRVLITYVLHAQTSYQNRQRWSLTVHFGDLEANGTGNSTNI